MTAGRDGGIPPQNGCNFLWIKNNIDESFGGGFGLSSNKKNSRWSRYDSRSKLWIKGKLIYLYWFRFLQHAESNPTKEVDWKRYPYWGGADVVCNMKFEEWWRPRWKRLFGYKDPKNPDPMFSPTYPHKIDAIRYALRFYELEQSGITDKWELAKEFAKEEHPRRREYAKRQGVIYDEAEAEKWVFNVARAGVIRSLNQYPAYLSDQKRLVQSRVGRILKRADVMLDNVCEGKFP